MDFNCGSLQPTAELRPLLAGIPGSAPREPTGPGQRLWLSRGLHLLVLFSLLAPLSCRPQAEPCQGDSDCASGLCLHDLDRGDRYCSDLCEDNLDCLPTRRCDVRITGAPGDESVVSLCIERVRDCGGEEICNGLDDNCNGDTDESCTQATCLADEHCGGLWPCQPLSGGLAVCAPPIPEGKPPGTYCSTTQDCYNGLCEVGICAPVCGVDSHCPADERCARASRMQGGVAHETCHLPCNANRSCPAGLVCTLRAGRSTCSWRAVCSPLRGSRTLGQVCGDHDDCASALCLSGVCTRPCVTGGDCAPGLDCTRVAVSPDPLACMPFVMTVCL